MITVNAMGDNCPIPVIKTKKAMAALTGPETIEEKVTRKCVMDDDIDVIINVVDASSLERNLYLTLQLLELGKPGTQLLARCLD